jgi:endonuclease I
MQKKIRPIFGVVAILLVLFGLADSYFELGILNSINQVIDQEGPVINTDELPSKYLLNSSVDFQVSCTDNYDDTCLVTIEGTFDTTTLGEHTLTLKAIDQAGNETTFYYTYEVINTIDPSIYIPLGYYDSIDGLSGDTLKSKLNQIIGNHTEFPYTSDSKTDVWDILREADEDPDNNNNIIAFYTGLSIQKDCQDTTYPPDFCTITLGDETKTVEWNREHVWSKSRGDFSDESEMGAHTDAHHLVAAERVMNSTKNNRFFEDCHDGDDIDIVDRGYGNYTCNVWEFEPRDEVKGDVARMIFYMAVRYDDAELDLEVVNDPDEDKDLKLPVYGDIDDLLRWHIQDPVDEKEVLRNQVVYSYQGNRNPFIDKPELVELVFGTPEQYQVSYRIDFNPYIYLSSDQRKGAYELIRLAF